MTEVVSGIPSLLLPAHQLQPYLPCGPQDFQAQENMIEEYGRMNMEDSDA